jgi:hypothetical protein
MAPAPPTMGGATSPRAAIIDPSRTRRFRQENDMEREIQACADALMRLGRGRSAERLDEFEEYARACAAAAQILMTTDTAPLAEAIKRLAVAEATCVADAIRILARATPGAAAMGAQPWGST